MKEHVIKSLMIGIKSNTSYDEIKLAEIKYGITSLYLLITKFIVITLLAVILGIFRKYLIFVILYNFIRRPSFGLHASKSWMCWISSTIIFIGIPYLCGILEFSVEIKCLMGIFGICSMYMYSPADTKKKPIVSKKLRLRLKYTSVICSILFVIMSLIINNRIISNSLILAIVLQSFIISPYVYRLFGLPYNNYVDFLKKHPDFPTE